MQIQGEFDLINKDLDVQLNKIKSMEHFIDKYIPIRVQQLIGETFSAIVSQTQLQRLQNFEMEKYKKLNEDVLDDETHPELIDLMHRIAADLKDIMNKFKAVAKAKGIRYEVAGAKKDAMDAKIMGNSSKDGVSNAGNAFPDARSVSI